MKFHNMIGKFNREIEILDVNDNCMHYVLDKKSDKGNLCEILCYDFENDTDQYLFSFPSTRLYESFRTYDAERGFFYVETVDDDYRMHLCRIGTEKWVKEGIFDIMPDGEILNIFPIDRRYMTVVEEIRATDDSLYELGDEDFTGRYYILMYVYDLITCSKYYFQKYMDYHQITEIRVSGEWLFMNARSSKYSSDRNDYIYAVSKEKFASQLAEGKAPELKIAAQSAEGGTLEIVRRSDNVLKLFIRSQAGICCRTYDKDLNYTEVIYETADNTVYADASTGKIMTLSENDGKLTIKDEDHNEYVICYDSEYGEFEGLICSEKAATVFYKSEMLREDMVFRECVAVYDLNDQNAEPEIYEGCCRKYGDHLVLLKSYLYL